MLTADQNATFTRLAPAIFVILWSTGYVGARYGLPYAEPMTLCAIRFVIASLLLYMITRWRGARLPTDGVSLSHLAVSGFLIQAAFVGGIFVAVELDVDIGIAALIAGVQPLLTACLAVPLFGEVLNRRQWLGFILGFGGLSLVVVRSFDGGAISWPGFAACVVALGGITFGTLYQKRFATHVDLFAGATVQFAAAAVICAVLAMCFETGSVEWSPTLLTVLFWLCVVMSVGAVSILLFLIREGAASKVSSLFYLVPPATAAQGYVLFDQKLGSAQLAGMVITAIGVAMINLKAGGQAIKSGT